MERGHEALLSIGNGSHELAWWPLRESTSPEAQQDGRATQPWLVLHHLVSSQPGSGAAASPGMHRDAGAARGPCVARSCSSPSHPVGPAKPLGKRLWLLVTPVLLTTLANDCRAPSYLSNEQQLASG